MPATRKIFAFAVVAAAPVFPSSRKNNGQAARIQPIVPPIRTRPNSFSAFFMCANAIELETEIVGT